MDPSCLGGFVGDKILHSYMGVEPKNMGFYFPKSSIFKQPGFNLK